MPAAIQSSTRVFKRRGALAPAEYEQDTPALWNAESLARLAREGLGSGGGSSGLPVCTATRRSATRQSHRRLGIPE
jgi:hypothetical protein